MDTQDVNGNDWFVYRPERRGGATDKGPRRAENQDAFWIPGPTTPTELGALYLVADGVGGQQDGAVASQLAVQTVQQVFYDLRKQGEAISAALKEALERANQAILEESQKRQVRKMGSTFVAAALDRDQLMVAHVGDARAYLIRSSEMTQLTRDDTWVQRQVDAGLITEEEAAQHEFRNVVTQVLGNKPDITVNLSRSHSLQPGDAIMLCSDGLYDVLQDAQMTALIMENEPQLAAESLVKAAVAGEATDNITAVVVRMGEALPFADEPTLISVPAAAEATLATAVPLADEGLPTIIPPIEDAQTVAIQAPPKVPPAAKGKEKGGISKWLIILAIVAVLLIVGAIGAFWWRSSNLASDVDEAVATAQPELVETLPAEVPAGLKTLVPTMTMELVFPTEVPTLTPTTTPLPDTPTPRPTDAATAIPENLACVNDGLFPFVWTENQIRTENCDTTQIGLTAGDEVLILEEEPIFAAGNCGGAQFVKVQSVAQRTIVGWMRQELVDRLEPGESCTP